MGAFIKLLKGICHVCLIICCIAVTVLMLFTVYNVIMRYVFSNPNSGVAEWSQILLIISMTGMGFAVADGRATRVGILVDRFPKKLNIAFEIITGIIGIAFFAISGWRLFVAIESSIRFREAYFFIGFPRWPSYLALGIAFSSAAIGSVVFMHKSVTQFKPAVARGMLEDNPEIAILMADGNPLEEGKESEGGGE